jgi:hypothetical protein
MVKIGFSFLEKKRPFGHNNGPVRFLSQSSYKLLLNSGISNRLHTLKPGLSGEDNHENAQYQH